MAPIICKLSFGDETRRFTVDSDTITYDDMHSRAKLLFDFDASTKFKLQYKDDEGDVITMSTNSEMGEALRLAVDVVPSILRVSVKMSAPAEGGAPPASTDKTTTKKIDAASATSDDAPARAPAAPPKPAAAPDLAALIANISEHLPKVLDPDAVAAAAAVAAGAPPPPCAPADLSALMANVQEALPQFVASLPECIRSQMNNAELDVAATMAANMAATMGGAAPTPGSKPPGVSFSVLPPDAPGYGDANIHPGVTCDKSGMCPIVGNRYNLKGHNYDLCEAEFAKLPPAEQAKFVKIEPPFSRRAADESPKEAQQVHWGVTCDKSGVCPIVGPRYNLKGHNYDLCEAEFAKLPPAEQANFVKMDAPPFPPWRPKCWRGGRGPWAGHGNPWAGHGNRGPHPHAPHPHGGPNGGHGGDGAHGCHGAHNAHKLAARFVCDVSIFDGTQMAPGTPFTKIWRLKNVGEVPWPAGTKLLFVGGDQMSAELTVPLSADNKVVMPGEEVDVAVDMVAPSELGRYLGYWRLVGPMGRRRFGQRVWSHIQVVDPAATFAPHDPKEIATEISHLMAKARKDDPDPDEPEATEAEATEAEPLAPAPAAAAASSPASASSSCSASVVSSVAPSVASSAVSVSKVEAVADDDVVVPADEPKDTAPPAAPAAPEKEAAAEAKAAPSTESPQNYADVATELMKMGFEPKSVELVMEKNAGVYPVAALLESCSRDLVQLSEWDSMLSDLEEMGFDDREKNTRLMMKHSGSVKRAVKDLVADVM